MRKILEIFLHLFRSSKEDSVNEHQENECCNKGQQEATAHLVDLELTIAGITAETYQLLLLPTGLLIYIKSLLIR